jgi:hypothetical protein
VWLYVWEVNYAEIFSLSPNGQAVGTNWLAVLSARGPSWLNGVSVTVGSVQLTSAGGTLNRSGLEV